MLLFCLIWFVVAGSLGAATETFTGPNDGAWETAGNWSGGSVPQNGDVVVIPDSAVVDLESTSHALAGLTVDGTLTVGASAIAVLSWSGSQTWGGTGAIVFGAMRGNAIHDSSGVADVLTIAASLTIQGSQATIIGNSLQRLTNQGTITCDVPQGEFDISSCDNTAEISESAGGTIALLQTWTSAGTILGSGSGTIDLEGQFSTTDVATLAPGSGETVNLIGTLDNSGAVLALDASTGPWFLEGGEIDGGTITTDGANTLIATTQPATLSAVTISSGSVVDMTQLADPAAASLVITNGLQLDGLIAVGSATNATASGMLLAYGTQTWTGAGEVRFGLSAENGLGNQSIDDDLTLASGLHVDGASGSVSINLVNQGVISCDTAGGQLIIAPASGVSYTLGNTGTIQATSGGSVYLGGDWTNSGAIGTTDGTIYLGGAFATATASLPTITSSGTGVIALDGVLSNTGQTVTLTAGTGPWEMLDGGIIVGGALTTTASDDLVVGSGYQGGLDGVVVTLGSVIDVTQPNAVLNITGGMTLNGQIDIGASTASASTVSWTGTQTWNGSGLFRYGGNSGDLIVHAGTAGEVLTYVPPLGATRPLTITATSQTMVTGSSVPVLTDNITGFVAGDTVTSLTTAPVLTTTATAASPAGSYPITVGGATDPNYTIAFVAGTMTVADAAGVTTATTTTGTATSATTTTGTGSTTASSTSGSGSTTVGPEGSSSGPGGSGACGLGGGMGLMVMTLFALAVRRRR